MIYLLGIIAVIIGVIIDQATKHFASSFIKDNTFVIIKDVLELRYLENRGAAFGMLQNQQWVFLIITVITICIITYIYIKLPRDKHFKPIRLCLISLMAGAIGNMIDRIRLQYVIDFIYFKIINFPIFNVADIFATVATFVLIILFIFYYSEEDFDLIFNLCFPKRKNKQESC